MLEMASPCVSRWDGGTSQTTCCSNRELCQTFITTQYFGL